MATIIDALIVTLGLDAKGYTTGSKQATKSLKDTGDEAARVAKDMEARGKQAAQFFGKLRNEALGLLAVFTAGVGIKNFVEGTITSAASLGRMSENLDMSAKDLAMWQLANKNAGGSAEGMTAQLKAQADEIANIKMGQSPDTAQWFYRLGGNPDDLRKDVKTALMAKSKIVSELYKKDPILASSMSLKLGINDDSFNLLKKTPDMLEAARQAQSRLADEQAKASIPMESFRKKLDTLKNNFEAVGVKILTSLMPQFDRFANWLDQHRGDIEEWANKASAAIERFVKWADDAAQSVGGWKNVLIALIALEVLSIVSPILSLAAALATLATSMGAVGGVAGAGALSVLGRLVGIAAKLGVGAALLFHTDDLNAGEDEELAKRRSGGSSGRSASGKVTDGTTSDKTINRQNYLASALKNDGYTDAQSAGIIGSLKQENSTFDPKTVNAIGATGIAQWLSKDRKQGFEKRYGHGLDKSTFEEQTDFMLWELRNTEKRSGDLLRQAKTPEQAAQIHAQEYERPGVAEANIDKRKENATRVYSEITAPANSATLARADGPVTNNAGDVANDNRTANYWHGDTRTTNNSNTSNDNRTANTTGAINTVNMVNAVQAQAPARSVTSSSNSSTSETNINGPITIMSQATDAKGIARDLGQQLGKVAFAAQTNTGLQ